MKRFTWRLQRVLDIKTKEEQKKRAELLEISGKLAKTRSELLNQQVILKEIIADIAKEEPKKRLKKQELFLQCSTTTNRLIKTLKARINELELQQKEKVAEVLKIRRFKKGLEKLRIEAKTKFIKHEEQLEQKESDEGANIIFVRKIMQQSGL
jgi:flagellar protein FliJ